jgi:hypothetical protein
MYCHGEWFDIEQDVSQDIFGGYRIWVDDAKKKGGTSGGTDGFTSLSRRFLPNNPTTFL